MKIPKLNIEIILVDNILWHTNFRNLNMKYAFYLLLNPEKLLTEMAITSY